MTRIIPLTRCLIVLALMSLVVPLAYSQMTTYTNSEIGYRIDHPANWQLELDEDGVQIKLNEDIGAGVYALPLSSEEGQALGQFSVDQLGSLFVQELQQEFVSFQVTQTSERMVAGVSAAVVDFSGIDPETQTPGTGRIVVFLTDDHLYAMVFAADTPSYPQHQATFEAMLASFTLGAQAPDTPGAVINPLDPEVLPEPEPENPLAPVNPLAPSDPLVGTFADAQLSVTLQGGAGEYSGEIIFGGQTFPAAAQGEGNTLMGTFTSGANQFDFTATLEGDTLTFVTGGTTYMLERE